MDLDGVRGMIGVGFGQVAVLAEEGQSVRVLDLSIDG
jgi:hypothetical protein